MKIDFDAEERREKRAKGRLSTIRSADEIKITNQDGCKPSAPVVCSTARTMEWATRISRDLNTSFIAEQRLRNKCHWEGMSRTAVILEWGDPRKWKP